MRELGSNSLPRTTCREPLGRTTERPARECGDSPCEIIFSVKTLWIPLAAISRGEYSGLPATLWSRGRYSTGQSHGRKYVVRG